MITSTSSTDVHVLMVFDFTSTQARLAPPGLPSGGCGGRFHEFADAPDYPSAAMIEYLTQQIIAAIIFGDADSDLGKPRN